MLNEDNLSDFEKLKAQLASGNRVIMPHVYLRGVRLSHADLHEANLSHANLHNANLSCTTLHDANLSHTHLCWVNLSYADLRWVNLSHANLRRANLYHANLYEANLSHADLHDTNFEQCHMNWLSHELISTRLWQAAITIDQKMLAAFIGQIDWCWKEWLGFEHPAIDWALRLCVDWQTVKSPLPVKILESDRIRSLA